MLWSVVSAGFFFSHDPYLLFSPYLSELYLEWTLSAGCTPVVMVDTVLPSVDFIQHNSRCDFNRRKKLKA